MVIAFLIRWGPLIVLLLSVGAHLGHTYWFRPASRQTATPSMADSAPAFMREIFRRALGVMLLYFLCRAVVPQTEQDFGRIDWLAIETVRLAGLAVSFLSALWLVAVQIMIGEHWGVGVPTSALPWLVDAGPFTVSRNPVFLGVVAEAIGLFLTSPTAASLMALTAIWLGAQLQVRFEEDSLRVTYGSDYIDYCKRVRRWI